MTDPTPRTAATARDALAALVKAIDYTHGTRHLRHADQPKALRMAGADCYCSVNAAVDDARLALAAAEAPGRVAATPRTAATARERVDVDAVIRNWWNDGPRKTWRKDFADPDTRRDWLEELGRQMTRALAAAEAPGRVAGEVCGDAPIRCHLPPGHDGNHHDGEGGWARTPSAPAPTPSEPVGRVPEELRKWLLAVDKEHTGTVPGGLRLRHGRCTTCGMLKVGLDAHPTPATRDE